MILNPFGMVCASLQPIIKSHFDVSFTSPSGRWRATDNVEILSIPELRQSVGVESYTPFNSRIPYASFKEGSQGELKFRFFDGTSGFSFWKGWFNKVYSSSGDAVGVLSEYVGNGQVSIYRPVGTGCAGMSLWGTISMENCWPSSISIESLDMNSDEPLGYSVTLQMTDVSFS